MGFIRNLRTLGGALGSWGTGIISRLQEIGQTVASALRLGKVAGVEVEPAAVVREWGEVKVEGERAETFALLDPGATIPVEWYTFSEVPWKKSIAYRFQVYGRDLVTGRFFSEPRDVVLSRPTTPGEAEDVLRGYMDTTGKSPEYEIFSMKLVGASRREGDAWRW